MKGDVEIVFENCDSYLFPQEVINYVDTIGLELYVSQCDRGNILNIAKAKACSISFDFAKLTDEQIKRFTTQRDIVRIYFKDSDLPFEWIDVPSYYGLGQEKYFYNNMYQDYQIRTYEYSNDKELVLIFKRLNFFVLQWRKFLITRKFNKGYRKYKKTDIGKRNKKTSLLKQFIKNYKWNKRFKQNKKDYIKGLK
jgi:hypothetical protein